MFWGSFWFRCRQQVRVLFVRTLKRPADVGFTDHLMSGSVCRKIDVSVHQRAKTTCVPNRLQTGWLHFEEKKKKEIKTRLF